MKREKEFLKKLWATSVNFGTTGKAYFSVLLKFIFLLIYYILSSRQMLDMLITSCLLILYAPDFRNAVEEVDYISKSQI